MSETKIDDLVSRMTNIEKRISDLCEDASRHLSAMAECVKKLEGKINSLEEKETAPEPVSNHVIRARLNKIRSVAVGLRHEYDTQFAMRTAIEPMPTELHIACDEIEAELRRIEKGQ